MRKITLANSFKKNRTSFENGNINAVMDGDLDGFINAYLKMQSQKNLENN